MRTISSGSLGKLAQQFGSEPINIIEVQWALGAQRTAYADRDLDGGAIKGRITAISGLDFIIDVSEGSDSAEISITLSDVDGDLKSIIDTVDIHKRDVWVYQYFAGLATSERFLIFRGEINSPIEWNEGDRTLSFSVITKIEDAEIGFSIEEGQFELPDQALIGKAWPLKFGTTINVPACRFSTPRKGILSTGVGISDFTLPFRIESAQKLNCPFVFRGFRAQYVGAFQLSLQITPVFTVDEQCALNVCETQRNLQNQLDEQRKFEFGQIVIIDGELFPQGGQITLNIDGGKFTGQFLGTSESPSNIFQIVSREHPDQAEIGIPTEESVIAAQRQAVIDAVNQDCGGAAGGDFIESTGGISSGLNQPVDESRRGVELSERAFAFFNAIPTASFFFASPGSAVTIDNGEPIVYATNLLPETITRVAAFRNFDGNNRRLVTVPASFYTTRITDFQNYDVTEVVLNEPLSRLDQGWEDDLYITATSSIGPNTVNIMEWLIQKYTSLGIDTTSFNSVRAKLAVYPMDFPYLERKNILLALQELAFQARCAIYLRDGKFFLKYLPELASSVDTITESDVDTNSLILFHSDTEDIVTKLVAEWQRDYSLEESNKIILRHNVEKYGTQEETFSFYAFGELDYVHKSATFWLIRKSNTWRKAKFETPLQKLKLETFDTANLTLPDIASGTIPSIIEKANYNSDNKTLEFEVWTPIRSGETTQYDFAFPANISQTLQFPTLEDRQNNFIGSGSAPGFSTTPPSGHPLASSTFGLFQGFSFGPCASQGLVAKSFVDQTCGNGNGDTYPSDQGDTVKPKDTEGGAAPDSPQDPGEINAGDGPTDTFGGNSEIDDLRRRITEIENATRNAQSTANAANEAASGSGSSTSSAAGGGSPEAGNLPTRQQLEDAAPAGENPCLFSMNVFVFRADVVFKTGEVGSQPQGAPGQATLQRIDQWTFKTCEEAQEFTQAIIAQANARRDAEDISIGEVLPLNAVSLCAGTPPECTDCNPLPTPRGYDATPTNDGADPPNPPDYQDSASDFFGPPRECP